MKWYTRSCERPMKRSASEALPSSVSNRYSLSTRTQGSSCRRRASSSLWRVSSFSAASSSSRAASHSFRVPVMCFVIGLLSLVQVSPGPCSSPQVLDPLGKAAGVMLPALIVLAAHSVVGEPVVRQHHFGGAAGRRQLDGHPGLESPRHLRHPGELQEPRALDAEVAAVMRPQPAFSVGLPVPELVDRGLAQDGP